jgi:glycosyltransferase involved in cell wall biosynthesis
MTNACTIVACNFLPQASILAESFAAHHPDGNFTVLLIDDEDRSFDETPFGQPCLRLRDIGLSALEIAELVSIYEVTELATAVKPMLLRYLLVQGRDHILYLDPDIKIYDSLEHAATLASQHGIVLTPHMTAPLPKDGLRITDAHILSSGIYNLGFIGLGTDTEAFIDWWWSKTRRDALVDHENMMFTDQRWIDYVPAFFRHSILKHPGYNVAYWNLHERDLIWTGNRYLVGGHPLAFFHFSGYSKDSPHLLSKHQGDRPRILLSERPALRRICAEYQADLERIAGQHRPPPYGWDVLPSGMKFDRRMRRLYRRGLIAFERDGAPPPPAPFANEPKFIEWLKQPVAAGVHPRVSRYLYSVYEDRADLRAAFPHLEGDDCANYFMWLHGDGVLHEGLSPALLPPLAECVKQAPGFDSPPSIREGINLAGYFRAELGIGEVARILRSTIEFAGIPYETIDYSVTANRKNAPFSPKGSGRAAYDVNIVCVNADRSQAFANDVGPGFFRDRYSIGYWFWELEQFPASMHGGFDAVDEVWTATRFVAESIERIGRRPVHQMPLALPELRCDRLMTRESLRLPPGFLFLFTFDFFSLLERKNPLGVVKAFRRAFEPGEGPLLLLKTINGDKRVSDLERVRAAAADRPDIRIIDGYFTAEQKNALIRLGDCYVSLHRAEGLGLTLAEAMALNRPVIATAYSGNLEFMTPENSYLVDYDIGSVPSGCDPYPTGSRWANPRTDHAAALMRRVFENRDDAVEKAARGRRDIETMFSVKAAAEALTRRLAAIRTARVAVSSPASLDTADPKSLGSASTEAWHPPGRLSVADRLKHQLFRVFRLYGRLRRIRTRVLDLVKSGTMDANPVTSSDGSQRQALERVWNAVHALESRQDQLIVSRQAGDAEGTPDRRGPEVNSAGLAALTEQRLSAIEHEIGSIASTLTGHADQEEPLHARIASIETRLAAVQRRLDELQRNRVGQQETIG